MVRIRGDMGPSDVRTLEAEFQRMEEELQPKGDVMITKCATSSTLPAPVRDGLIRVVTSANDIGTIAISPTGEYWYDILNGVTVA